MPSRCVRSEGWGGDARAEAGSGRPRPGGGGGRAGLAPPDGSATEGGGYGCRLLVTPLRSHSVLPDSPATANGYWDRQEAGAAAPCLLPPLERRRRRAPGGGAHLRIGQRAPLGADDALQHLQPKKFGLLVLAVLQDRIYARPGLTVGCGGGGG